MSEPFMRAINHSKTLLTVNNVSIDDLEALVLVGGPTQILRFRELIEQELTKPETSLNPMTAIAEEQLFMLQLKKYRGWPWSTHWRP